MIHPFDKLPHLAGIRDYSGIEQGDMVEIPSNSIMLKAMMKNALGREKMAMEEHAQRIGCTVEEIKGKRNTHFKFN